MPTKAEAQAYLDHQNLPAMLNECLNQVVKERAPDAAARFAELLAKAARDRESAGRMQALFAQADTTGNGFIDMDELRTFMAHMGEPLEEDILKATFADIASPDGVDFKAFSEWYPKARAAGGALSKKGDFAVQRRRRASRASRASKEGEEADVVATSFSIVDCKPKAVGEPNTLEFRVQLLYPDGGAALPEDGGGLKQISPWHDIPLYPPGGKAKGEVHMVVEIPKWSRAKYEIATGEDFNPIKQDVKKGKLREYNYGDMLVNYGCFPQTWEDPAHTTPDTQAAGDNDPIDAMEIGSQIFPVGHVVKVKVLGCLAMIDDGETDWKVICINVNDPLAAQLDDIGDVERLLPGYVSCLREWLRLYKTVDGKPKNEFGLDEKALDKAYTLAVVEETHEFWKGLIAKGLKTV